MANMTRLTGTGIFRARLQFLVDEQGLTKTARFYGRTPRSVQRWLDAEATPSQRIRESVRRRGLTAGAPQAVQVRTRGRFTSEGTIATGGSLNAVTAINRRLRRVRDAEIRRARRSGDDRRMRVARALPTRLSQGQAQAIALRRERLVTGEPGRVGPSGEIQVGDTVVGEPERRRRFEEDDYWNFVDYDFDDWDQWRSDYVSSTS